MAAKMTPQVQRLLGDAMMHHIHREFQQAVPLLLQIIRLAPNLAQPYQTLGLIYEELQQHSKSIKLFIMAAHVSKRDSHQWKQLVVMATKHGELQQALFCVGRVLALNPNDADAMWERVMLLGAAGELKKAAAALQAMHVKMPTNAQVVLQLARSLYKLGQPARAEKLLEGMLRSSAKATARGSSGVLAEASSGAVSSDKAEGGTGGVTLFSRLHCLNMLLELYMERGRYDEALKQIEQVTTELKADRSSWNPPVELCVKKGVCLAYLGDTAAALALWEALFARVDRLVAYADQLFEVAFCLLQMREWARSLAIYTELTETSYRDSVHFPQGRCLLELGRTHEAAEAFTRAFELDPTDTENTLAITELLALRGRPADALVFLERHALEASQRQHTVDGNEPRDGKTDPSAPHEDATCATQFGPEVERELEATLGGGLHAELLGAAETDLDTELDVDLGSETGGAAGLMTGSKRGIFRRGAAPNTLANDARFKLVRGFALAALGNHEEAVQMLLPIAEECHRSSDEYGWQRDDSVRRYRRKRRRVYHADEMTDAEGSEIRSEDSGGANKDESAGEEGEEPSGEEAEACVLEAIGMVRYLHVVAQVAGSLVALGRHHAAFGMVSRVLDGARHDVHEGDGIAHDGAHESRLEGGASSTEASDYWMLCATCVRLAFACGEWTAAYQHARNLCVQRPHSWMGWTLLYSVSAKENQRGLDERWLLRTLLRRPSADQVAVGVAHKSLLSRSLKSAMAEYLQLLARYPNEPMLALCAAVTQLQLMSSRTNKHRGHSTLLGFGWLEEYSKSRDEQEVAYNLGRAHHHLGLLHLAAADYERVLQISAQRKRHPEIAIGANKDDLAREAAHNLARICLASGTKALARKLIRSLPL
ncbi:hypothetical protein AB1Y20_012741 [Prymnesium parvum]|uniref:Uncharacterized protein n=1 Tax=Prymnesium parvum TaxID=97485 RepID=A0AB34IJJ6_PRYPA